MSKFEIGTRVEGGAGEDYDIGTVIEATGLDATHPMSNDNVYVAWDSGVRTWTPSEDPVFSSKRHQKPGTGSGSSAYLLRREGPM